MPDFIGYPPITWQAVRAGPFAAASGTSSHLIILTCIHVAWFPLALQLELYMYGCIWAAIRSYRERAAMAANFALWSCRRPFSAELPSHSRSEQKSSEGTKAISAQATMAGGARLTMIDRRNCALVFTTCHYCVVQDL